MVKIGDRVRFLNSVGGGVVRSFQNKEIVLVEEEDGFETPVLIRECVVVESINRENNMPEKNQQSTAVQSVPLIIRHEPEPELGFDYEETPEGDKLSAYLAFIPHDIKLLQTTAYDVFLINDCNYFLHYNIAKLGFDVLGQYNGLIEPNTKYQFASVTKDQLNDWERVAVQFLAFKKKEYSFKPVVDIELKINPVKFYKLHSFISNDYFTQLAMLIAIIKDDGFASDYVIDTQQLKEALGQKKESERRTRIERKAVTSNDIIELDLHINELLDSTAGMSNSEMLQYQMDKFNELMNEYRGKKGQKIVFIHGKGEGVLRNELMKQLRSKYSNCYVQDASFREYGFGATMVTIK